MNCKKVDRLFSGSASSQLLKILGTSAVVLALYFLFSEIEWRKIVAMFIDPGSLENSSPWVPQLILTLIGFILFSVLLSSVITAWVTNLNDNIRDGRRRYRLSNHVIVFGTGNQLSSIIDSIDSKTEIVVVSKNRPCKDRKNVIYYNGERNDRCVVEDTFPHKASTIYIIGDENEPCHDSYSLKCLDLLKDVTKDYSGNPINCFITFNDEETMEAFYYLKGDAGNLSSRLYLVDAINVYEYRAEQFVINSDFIPVLKKESPKKAHFILFGTGNMTQAMAYTLAHACHYPKYNGRIRKTCITIIDHDALGMRDKLLLARPHLFNETVYESINSDGKSINYKPKRDILDIEWRFVKGSVADESVCSMMQSWVNDGSLDNRIIICNMESSEAVYQALHLPFFVYGNVPVAVYLEESAELIEYANRTKMYGGNISVFGPASSVLSDPLLKHRSECGQRVNFVYEKAYSSKEETFDTPINAWYRRSESDKFSSIYCAIGLPLREKTFNMNTDIEEVYEAEHRRWMMSEYLMGFRYGPKRDKELFVHSDLVPFEDLPKGEQHKDKILIDNRYYILTGKGEPKV